MSGRLVGEVLRHAPADLTQLDLLVLVALAEAASDRDRIARHHVGTDDLADKCRSTPGAVKNAMHRLVHQRGLVVPLFAKPRRGLAQNYRIVGMTEATRRAVTKGSPTSDPARPPNGSPASDPETHDRAAGKGHQSVTQSPVENLTDPTEKGSLDPPRNGSLPSDPYRNNHLPEPKSLPTQVPAGVSE